MNKDEMEVELGRAYRAIRGLYNAAVRRELPDETVLAYHAPTIGAAVRFVNEEAMDGSEYFIGKPVDVLHDTLRSCFPKN